jgi:hypothetical protein
MTDDDPPKPTFFNRPQSDQERVIVEQHPGDKNFYRRLLKVRADYEASHDCR